ncbi:hypothetical protein TgHK011_003734 [Trichoderma gracile]|nr:hypothetical protein TgHK011_003734 [Trichoderma gracile]
MRLFTCEILKVLLVDGDCGRWTIRARENDKLASGQEDIVVPNDFHILPAKLPPTTTLGIANRFGDGQVCVGLILRKIDMSIHHRCRDKWWSASTTTAATTAHAIAPDATLQELAAQMPVLL